jgi:hypothetical protein
VIDSKGIQELAQGLQCITHNSPTTHNEDNMNYETNAALIDSQWSDADEAISEALTAQVQRECGVIEIDDLIKCEAADNAISTCEGDLQQYHDIYYSSLSQMMEDKLQEEA